MASSRPIIGARIIPGTPGGMRRKAAGNPDNTALSLRATARFAIARTPKVRPGVVFVTFRTSARLASQAVCVFVVACIRSYPILTLRGGRRVADAFLLHIGILRARTMHNRSDMRITKCLNGVIVAPSKGMSFLSIHAISHFGVVRNANYWTRSLSGTVSRRGAIPNRAIDTWILLASVAKNKAQCKRGRKWPGKRSCISGSLSSEEQAGYTSNSPKVIIICASRGPTLMYRNEVMSEGRPNPAALALPSLPHPRYR